MRYWFLIVVSELTFALFNLEWSILQVFVRPAGSYLMDQLELRRVTFHPGIATSKNADCVSLVGNFAVPASLHAAEVALSKRQVCLQFSGGDCS